MKTPGVAMIEYEDGERQLIDLRAEKFRDCVEGDESERDDDSLEGDDDVNDFSLIKKGAVIELLWPYVNIYFEAKIVSFCPLEEEKKQNVTKSKSMQDKCVDKNNTEMKRPHAENNEMKKRDAVNINEPEKKSNKTKRSKRQAGSNEFQDCSEGKLNYNKILVRQRIDKEEQNRQSPQSQMSTRSMACNGINDDELVTKPYVKSDTEKTELRETCEKKGELARNRFDKGKGNISLLEKDDNVEPDEVLASESVAPPAKSKYKPDTYLLPEVKSNKRPRDKDDGRDHEKQSNVTDTTRTKRSRKGAQEPLLTAKKQEEDALASDSSSYRTGPKDQKRSVIRITVKADEFLNPHTKPEATETVSTDRESTPLKPRPQPPPCYPDKAERRGKRDKKSSIRASSPLGTGNGSDVMSSTSLEECHSPHQSDRMSDKQLSNKKGSNNENNLLRDSSFAAGKDDSVMKKRKNGKDSAEKNYSRTAGLSRILRKKKCSVEHDEYLKSINSDNDSSRSGKIGNSSEKPPERIGQGVPLFNEPDEEFGSDVNESESDLSDDEIRQTAAGLDFEKMWRLKLDQTSEKLKSRRALGGYIDVKKR